MMRGRYFGMAGSLLLGWICGARIIRYRLTHAGTSHRILTANVELKAEQTGLTFKNEFAKHPGLISFIPSETHQEILLGSPVLQVGGAWRPVLRGSLPPRQNWIRGYFSGHLGTTPHDFGLEFEELVHRGERVWSVPPAQSSSVTPNDEVIVIHIHGLGSGRSQVLRSIDTFSKLGFHSLASTYSTSSDRGRSALKYSSLGVAEAQSLHDVHHLATKMGAKKIVFVGWSLGASLILNYISRWGSKNVAGVLFVSPAIYWREILVDHLMRMGFTHLLAKWLRWSVDIFTLPGEIKLSETEPASHFEIPADLPILVLHGRDDSTVPVNFSRAFMERNGNHVTLIEFPNAHHTMEQNADTCKWQQSISSWCEGLGMIRKSESIINGETDG